MGLEKCKKYETCGLLILRVVVGLIFLLAGYAKLFSVTPDSFASGLAGAGVPLALLFAWVVAIAEFIGGILLILGAFVRWTSIPLIAIMVVAIITKWFGNFGSEGFTDFGIWRLDLLLFAALIVLLHSGAGKWALEKTWKKKV